MFVTKHIRVAGRDLWIPVHIRCNVDLTAGRARLDGRALATPPGYPVGGGLKLPAVH